MLISANTQEQTNGCLIKSLPSTGGNMWACNYDFARDYSHSSDLNVVWFCEGKRQHFDEVLPLHQRDRTIHLHQRNPPPPPSSSPPLSCLYDLGVWHPLSSKRQEQRPRRITEGYGSSLKRFRGFSISFVSS